MTNFSMLIFMNLIRDFIDYLTKVKCLQEVVCFCVDILLHGDRLEKCVENNSFD